MSKAILVERVNTVHTDYNTTKVVIDFGCSLADMKSIGARIKDIMKFLSISDDTYSHINTQGTIIKLSIESVKLQRCKHPGCYVHFRAGKSDYCEMHNSNAFAAQRFLAARKRHAKTTSL